MSPIIQLRKRNYAAQRSPTLNTVLMIEETLQKQDGEVTVRQLIQRLPKQVMHQTVVAVLDYLEYSGKIVYHDDKVLWTYNPKSTLQNIRGTKV